MTNSSTPAALDKDGNEIFEHDIIEFQGSHFLVEFDDRLILTFREGGGWVMDLDDVDYTKITKIGNLHDNPELLS